MLGPFLERPIAHRGLHDLERGLAENSLSAAQAAIEKGFGIELDLQLSQDGVAMVFHDDGLSRLLGRDGLVRHHDARELERMPLQGTNDSVPSLSRFLELVKGRVPLLIELKDQSGVLSGSDGRLEQAVAHDLGTYTGPVALMSFNPDQVKRMAALCPNIPYGLVSDAFDPEGWPDVPKARLDELRCIDLAGLPNASFISHDHKDLDRPRVAEVKGLGLQVFTWTITNSDEAMRAQSIADNITFEDYDPDA